MKMVNPEEYKIPLYTQWAMIGLLIIIFVGLPESPCKSSSITQGSALTQGWLVTKGKIEEAEKVLLFTKGHLEGYSAANEIASYTLFHASIAR